MQFKDSKIQWYLSLMATLGIGDKALLWGISRVLRQMLEKVEDASIFAELSPSQEGMLVEAEF